MKILLIGSGGREHSLAIKLKESSRLTKLYIAPGNAGTAQVGENIPIKETETDELLAFAKKEAIDITVVGPEIPLVNGIVDIFLKNNLNVIGPNKEAAQLEGSKKWAKTLMMKYGIPTARFEDFNDFESAFNYIKERNEFPIVIKADGLAAGKGVTVAFSENEAKQALEDCFINNSFKDAGNTVVIEDFLKGEEASIFGLTDGKTVLPMTPAQDHKAIYDGDKGPNTGGMGAYSPAPIVTEAIEETVLQTIFLPLLDAFEQEGIEYKGVLYAGLMIDKGIPSVIEFNIRFGDPETQVVLPRLENDLIDIFEAIIEGTLHTKTLIWKKQSAICVILASGGYPGNYEKNIPIKGLEYFEEKKALNLVHAGTKRENNDVVTNGGRVMGVVGIDKDLKTAKDIAYKGVEAISFDKMYYRKDIGFKAL
jgi:phosphoribosylamine---glycine ligase